MYLDKILFDELEQLGTELKSKAGLNANPKNIEEMSKFISQIKTEIDKDSLYLKLFILFSMLLYVGI